MGNVWILIAVVGMMIGGLIYGRSVAKEKSESQYKSRYVQLIADGRLEKSEIEEMLASLPTVTDKDLSFGAMCYEAVQLTHDQVRYVCPICMHQTIYKANGENSDQWGVVTMVRQMDDIRRLVKQVKGVDLHLDERGFCRTCSPKVKAPHLSLEVRWGKGIIHRTEKITLQDLILLSEFARGEVIHKGDRDNETLLSNYTPRLRELLGFPQP